MPTSNTFMHRGPMTVLALAVTALLGSTASAQCPGDITGNGSVDGQDLGAVLAAWGSDGSSAPGSDVNSDGIVNGADLAFVIGGFGPCITVPAWATLVEARPDPAVVVDADLRAAIAATGLAWRVRDTATQIEMLLVPPGGFQMGCSPSNQFACASAEGPVHAVTLTTAYYLGRYEVTQAQWQATMGSNPSGFQGASAQVPASAVANRPVEQVTWNMIAGPGGFATVTGMRLPTEAEWEYAYRAGTTTAFHGYAGQPSGTNDDSLLVNIAAYNPNSYGQTLPVGGKAGNGLGLHDMSGSVLEWVNDWYSSGYYATSPVQDPTGPSSGVNRGMRGGSWSLGTYHARASYRSFALPGSSYDSVGFRAARNP
jgi:formylglycine-generating enzyme required for sulfatase activity